MKPPRAHRPKVTRLLLAELTLVSLLIRSVAGRLHLPTRDRLDLLRIATRLDRIVERMRR